MKHTSGLEPTPDAAGDIFGDRLDLAERYVSSLATTGIDHGLIGPREAERLWSRHILNCAVVGQLIGAEQSVIDIGSGAGLPGIPLAIARPDIHVTLIEPLERRVTWLRATLAELDLDVDVWRGRAEDYSGEASIVTSRAVAALDKLARWSLPLVAADGRMLALKGATAASEITQHRRALRRLGAKNIELRVLEIGSATEPTRVVEVTV